MERTGSLILEAIFPTRCVGCSADGSWCCEECLEAIEFVTSDPSCPSVGNDALLSGLVAVGFYHDPRVRALIHGLKYDLGTCLLPSFETLLERSASQRRDSWPWADEGTLGIQHVPAAPDRVRARGFDQAELLKGVVKETLVPWAVDMTFLERSATTKVQADLPHGPLREANVMASFGPSTGTGSIPKAVILVDDVFTTGATMRAAARILRSKGVERVYGVVFALGA
ncbi:MAG: phosphoribosyltransferase family protein [Patescibacteria group bacterium]